MSAKIIQQQADAAQYVFEIFATDSAEVAKHLGVSKSVARTRLAALEAKGLVCADLQEDPARGGLVNSGEQVGEHNVWQSADGSIDDTTSAEYAARVFASLGVWPTGHHPADVSAAPAESTTPADAGTTEGVPVTETNTTETAPANLRFRIDYAAGDHDFAKTLAQAKKIVGKQRGAAEVYDMTKAEADGSLSEAACVFTRDAVPAAAKKAPAKKAPAKKAPAKKAEPKAPTAADVAKIKPAASIAEDHAARIGDDAGEAAPGYVVRWPKKGYDLLIKTAAAPADAPKWLVRCNEHGTTLPVSGGREGDQKGRQSERNVWCPGCKKAAAKKAAK